MLKILLLRAALSLSLIVAGSLGSQARTVRDSAGRDVTVPDRIARVYAAGPPASTLLYVLAPHMMTGWIRKPSEAEKAFLTPSVRELPEVGRLTGRGDTLNLERLIADKPDLIIDFGTLNDTYKSLADRVQQQSGIAYLLFDGRFQNTATAIRLLADVLGVKERGEILSRAAEAAMARVDATLASIPAEKRPRVYMARGPEGLETGTRGSINTEIIERVGAINVVEGLRQNGGLAMASPEQILAWAPDTIVTLDRRFNQSVDGNAIWRNVPAVAKGRVYLAPSLPFGFVDSPPSLNRLIGLAWLTSVFYGAPDAAALREETRTFFRLFYQVELSVDDVSRLLSGN